MPGFAKIICCLGLGLLLCWPACLAANRLSPAPPVQPGAPVQKNPAAAPANSLGGTPPPAPGPSASQSEKAAGSPDAPQTKKNEESQASGLAENGPNPVGEKNAQPEATSLSGIGNRREEARGEPLQMPKAAENPAFLAGAWNFERTFLGQDGAVYRQDFIFNANGSGQAILRDGNENVFMAAARAELDGNALRIVTGPFVDEKKEPRFAPEYIECRAGEGGVECHGTDGFFAWSGERLLRDETGLSFLPENGSGEFSEQSGKRNEGDFGQKASGPDVSTPERGGPGQNLLPRRAGRVPPQGQIPQEQGSYAELSPDGAELSPVIMENSSKAKGDSRILSLSDLAGHWRYSRDFARRDDGKSVALEFHFDRDGRGYSVISDGRGNDARANAEAMLTNNGQIRVRTGAYGDSFYPTFMECRPGSPDLLCDVSNGWTRIENGKLVSIGDTENRSMRDKMTEILVMPEQASSGGNATEKGSSSSRVAIADILGDLPTDAATQRMQASASPTGGSQGAQQMVLPRNSEDTSFLQGRWRCNTGLVRTSDNQPIVVEFSFNKNGEGSATIREQTGALYRASAKASLRRGILRINTSYFMSQTRQPGYNKQFIECRDNGSQAICAGEGGGVHWDNATFTRLK